MRRLRAVGVLSLASPTLLLSEPTPSSSSSSQAAPAVSAHAGVDGSAPPADSNLSDPLQFYSQYGQDRFIFERFYKTQWATGQRRQRQGVFVELGAGDGIKFSNSLAFERLLNWTGVLIEPNPTDFAHLRRNRPNSMCVNECVARRAGTYEFVEDGLNSGLREALAQRSKADKADATVMECRTLSQILDDFFGGPGQVDLLSLDVEGAELDILYGHDFERHPIETIVVEVDTLRGMQFAERFNKYLLMRGYRFVERLVRDNIFRKRHGLNVDPACRFADVALQRHDRGDGDAMARALARMEGWPGIRESLELVSESIHGGKLPALAHEVARAHPLAAVPNDAVLRLQQIVRFWSDDQDFLTFEDSCGAGFLTMAVAMYFLRRALKVGDEDHVKALWRELVFQPPVRVVDLSAGLAERYWLEVATSEQNAENFLLKYPLGKSWHATSFLDMLQSGWPLFALLRELAREVTKAGFISTEIAGMEKGAAMNVPLPPCSLELLDNGEVMVRPRPMDKRSFFHSRGRTGAINDIGMDADVCGLLALAASHLHVVRKSVRVNVKQGPDNFLAVRNVSASPSCKLQALRGEGGIARSAHHCRSLPHSECAAIDSRGRAVPAECLRSLQRDSSAGLRLRRRAVLQGTQAASWLEEAERLIREFVRRHGLAALLWVSESPPFIPVQMEGLFATLDSIRVEMSAVPSL
eukprot:TRINITY_DN80584_c0_g1_i1.p1 TRINITY_DN80584_c0_g1~~TRINITY_DN80584_c0_g1_i1.p1  ORF type:complete len:698 (+),score=142.85 TRINITY_DN80584_c0_g1_i1:106-2199(+)